ncbi:MAG: hypothetical protein WC933_00125 [Candidatus Paceibacterota bacterium]|jgi:hypothetical protein
MKKTYLLSSIIILTILLSRVASAEIYSTTTIDAIKQTIINIKQQATEQKEILKEQIASGTANTQQELKSSIEIRIGKKLDTQKLKIANVFENSIQNLKDLISRIESRISKMEASNIDVSASKNLLDIAKINVTLAETELTNLAKLLVQEVPSFSTSTIKNTERRIILKNINSQSEKTKSAIKTAHKSIIETVASLKVGLLKEKEAASTSDTVSTSTNN